MSKIKRQPLGYQAIERLQNRWGDVPRNAVRKIIRDTEYAHGIHRHDGKVLTAQQWLPIESAPKEETTPFLVLVSVAGTDKPVAIQVSNFQGDMYPDHLGGGVDFDDRVQTPLGWMPLPASLATECKADGSGVES